MSNQTRPNISHNGEFDHVMRQYRSAMQNVKAAPELYDAVLAQAKNSVSQTREDTAGVRGARRRPADNQHERTTGQSLWSSFSLSSKRFRVALCIALAAALICAGSIVGWSLTSDQALSEAQDVQAPEESAGTEGVDEGAVSPIIAPTTSQPNTITLTLNKGFGIGGYSGTGYDPATDRFLDPQTSAGWKFAFSPICTGENIEKITYEIENGDGYFEMIAAGDSADTRVFQEGNPYGATPGRTYYYTKSISFDYDKQGFKPEDVIYSAYIHFPLDDEAVDLMQGIINGVYPNKTDNQEANDRLSYNRAQSATQELLQQQFKVTFTFKDGLTETRTYRISPVDN
ncbi:MAG: hypothetical protein RR672_14015, partial [Raoultibacter sp.]